MIRVSGAAFLSMMLKQRLCACLLRTATGQFRAEPEWTKTSQGPISLTGLSQASSDAPLDASVPWAKAFTCGHRVKSVEILELLACPE